MDSDVSATTGNETIHQFNTACLQNMRVYISLSWASTDGWWAENDSATILREKVCIAFVFC